MSEIVAARMWTFNNSYKNLLTEESYFRLSYAKKKKGKEKIKHFLGMI